MSTPPDWSRLPLWSIVYFVIQGAKRIARELFSNFIATIPLLYFVYQSIWLQLLLLGLVPIPIVIGYLYYYNFKFRSDHQLIEVHQGIFAKTHLQLPFDKVQNCTIEQPWYYRLLKRVILVVESPGSTQTEIKLAGLTLQTAKALQQTVQLQTKNQTASNDGFQDSDNANPLLVVKSIGELIKHGIAHSYFGIFVIWIPFASPDVSKYITNHFLEPQYQWLMQQIIYQQIGLIALMIATVILLFVLISIALTILTYYNLQLFDDNDQYFCTMGLVNKQQIFCKKSRIQSLLISQDWLNKLLYNRFVLSFQSLEFNRSNSGYQIKIPAVTTEQLESLVRFHFPNVNITFDQFRRISKQYIVKNMTVISLLSLIIGSFLYLSASGKVYLLLLAGITVIFYVGIVLRWYRYGYSLTEDHLVVREGLISTHYFIFALHKVQHCKIKQTVMMERKNLASLTLNLASISITIPYITKQNIYALYNQCLWQTNHSKTHWM